MKATIDVFKIGKAIQTGKLVMSIQKEEVTKEAFFDRLTNQIKEHTAEAPDQYEQSLELCKGFLSKPNMLTVGGLVFEYSIKKS